MIRDFLDKMRRVSKANLSFLVGSANYTDLTKRPFYSANFFILAYIKRDTRLKKPSSQRDLKSLPA